MKTSTKVILGVYGAFVGAWLAGSAYFLANGRDEELEEGLIPVEEPLPREENAYYLFPKLFTDDYLYPKSRPAASKQVLVQKFWKNKDRILNVLYYYEHNGDTFEDIMIKLSIDAFETPWVIPEREGKQE